MACNVWEDAHALPKRAKRWVTPRANLDLGVKWPATGQAIWRFGLLGCELRGGVLIGAETEQRANVAHPVEVRIVPDIEQFDVAQDGAGNDCLGYIFQFARLSPADWAGWNDMRIQMAARRTLDAAAVKAFANQ